MGARATELGRSLREQRRALGLTRSRLADRTGISSLDLTRWERGEALPDADQVMALAEAVGFDEAETRRWLDTVVTVDLTGPDVAVELLESPDPPSDPFAVSRTSLVKSPQPRLVDRLLAPFRSKEGNGASTGGSSGDASVTELRPTRRTAPARPAPSASRGLVREPRYAPNQLPSVFPDPPMEGYDPAVHVYSAAPATYPGPGDEDRYLLRRIRTTGVLIGLGLVLWWAFGSLWDGFGDVIELFRAPTMPTP